MLTLTENAAQVVRKIVSATPEIPRESGGVRIFATSPPDAQPMELAVAVAETPAEGDQVVVEEGARVFVASAAIDFLDDKVLDADTTDKGVRFIVAEQ